MLRFFYKHLNNKKGFTLMELIIVIAIIGILALIAVPRLTGFTDRAKERADQATAKSIENAIKILAASQDIPLSEFGGTEITFNGQEAQWSYKTGIGGFDALKELEELVELTKPQTGDYWLITVNGGTLRVEAKSEPANSPPE